jgi:hypothetical protein
MFKNRFILMIAMLSILMVTIAVSYPFSNVPASADLSWPSRPVVIPATGANDLSDYYQRHVENSNPAGTSAEASDYFVRHPELRTGNTVVDLSDYFLRH